MAYLKQYGGKLKRFSNQTKLFLVNLHYKLKLSIL